MYSVMFVLHEREGIERSDALAYWGKQHAELVSKVAGIRRYVQSHAQPSPDGDPPFLGIAVLEFDDEAAFQAASASPEMAAAVADAKNFADAERVESAIVEHVTIID
jgi:uncharacterized protein (TIGR02118 family)